MEGIIKFNDFFIESTSQVPLSNDIEKIDMETSKNVSSSDTTNQELSNDITELEYDDFGKLDGDWEIESIIDIVTAEDDDKVTESSTGIMGTHIDLGNKEIKRGKVFYITAMVKKPGNTSMFSQSKMSVIKVRVVDIYYGLSQLNKIINK